MTGGFLGAVRAAGVEGVLPEGIDLNTSSEQLHLHLLDLLRSADRPDGLICPGEIAALAALAAVNDVGLALGGEVDVLAKQTSRVFDLHRPKIETIGEDIEEAGRTMARALLDQIDGAAPEASQVLQAPQPLY
jgi:LacI family transcriptional regulator